MHTCESVSDGGGDDVAIGLHGTQAALIRLHNVNCTHPPHTHTGSTRQLHQMLTDFKNSSDRTTNLYESDRRIARTVATLACDLSLIAMRVSDYTASFDVLLYTTTRRAHELDVYATT